MPGSHLVVGYVQVDAGLGRRTTVGGVRTLTQWLRERSDDELRELLTARPDLVNPVPAHLGALAERAATQAAVTRALDRLDHVTLRVLEALAVLDEPVPYDELTAAFPEGDEDSVRQALRTLRGLALTWDDGNALRIPHAVRAALVQPADLGPPAAIAFRDVAGERLDTLLGDLGLGAGVDGESAADALAEHLAKPDVLDDLLAGAGAEARPVLDRLAWGPPVGSVTNAGREVRLATATSPVERLLARGLLAPAGGNTVVLPREVALHLRGGVLYRELESSPALDVHQHDVGQAERTAAGQAFAAIRTVEDLLELWGVDPPPVLRAGGLGVRELRRTARSINVSEDFAALCIEVAYAAGLIGTDTGVGGDWLPTTAYDVWRARSPEQRWVTLAGAWLETSRVPGLVGERDERDKPINALGQGLHRSGAQQTRHETLALLAELSPGASTTVESLRARLAWLRPRRWVRSRERLVAWTLTEAENLGVVGLGSLPAHGRSLLDGEAQTAAETLGPLLPETVDHILVQPDLTAVAPGPLTQELDRELTLAADVESTGGATVYRFSRNSIRRALDAGRTAGELIELLERHSRTDVPQPLRYLVDEVGRTHGRIRVGTASTYVRCDDPATLSELLADRRVADLGLRRLADTVLASRTGRQELLERLRARGYAPMAESAEGDVLLSRADSRRAASRDRPPQQPGERAGKMPGTAGTAGTAGASGPVETVETAGTAKTTKTAKTPKTMKPGSDGRLATAAVRALRAGDQAATASRRPLGGDRSDSGSRGDDTDSGSPPRSSAANTVAALRAATGDGQSLWIGYLDAQGHASSRIVEPIRVEGGFLTAYDSTRDAVHRFALHRITGVAALDDEPA